MAKTTKIDLQKRDWVIIALFLAILATNWLWYQDSKLQDLSHRNSAESWLMQQVQINKLKVCLDENTRPCDIASPVY